MFTHWGKQLCIWWPSSILARKYFSGLPACLPACLSGSGDCGNKTSQPNWRLWLANWAELGNISKRCSAECQIAIDFRIPICNFVFFSKKICFIKIHVFLPKKKFHDFPSILWALTRFALLELRAYWGHLQMTVTWRHICRSRLWS